MHVVHGTWIPDDTPDFIQSGSFYVWVEMDTPVKASRLKDTIHPRHLSQKALLTFLAEKLNVRSSVPAEAEANLCTKYFLLPTVEGKPAASFELLRYVEEEEPLTFGTRALADLLLPSIGCYPYIKGHPFYRPQCT